MRREKVGFVFQTFNLVPYLSALENVQVPLFLAKVDEKAQKDRATALLERVGLADRLDHKPGELSVGQQQRVALARMLANDPAVILADEPTGNLDPETSQQIIGFLEEFNAEGKTIVMVTHDPRAAKRAKRTLRLQNGAITCQGMPVRTVAGSRQCRSVYCGSIDSLAAPIFQHDPGCSLPRSSQWPRTPLCQTRTDRTYR